jgi:hypothetical protein
MGMREIRVGVSYNFKKEICVGVQMPTVIRSGDGDRVVQGRCWAWLLETPFFWGTGQLGVGLLVGIVPH